VLLEPSDTYEVVIRKLGSGLRRRLESLDNEVLAAAKQLWGFLKRWEVLGVKYAGAAAQAQRSEFLDELAHTYATACSDTAAVFDGVLVLIDEADKPSVSAGLGTLLKGFTERLSAAGCSRVAVGVAGVSAVIERLQQSHESSPRLFTMFDLKPLPASERHEVITRGLDEAAEKNGFVTAISPEAAERIALYSEGYPHFIQQFAYCAFEADTDNNIDMSDVMEGAWGEHGAFDQLGKKYFEDLYFDKIGSDDYRQVLRAMAERLDGWVTKADIRAAVQMKPTILNNALTALKARGIIVAQPGHKGVYRLPLKSFAAWIRAFTSLRAP